jgi:hypothetical protein
MVAPDSAPHPLLHCSNLLVGVEHPLQDDVVHKLHTQDCALVHDGFLQPLPQSVESMRERGREREREAGRMIIRERRGRGHTG